MARRRTVRTTIGDLMIAVMLIALYLAPLRLNKMVFYEPRTLAAVVIGVGSLGTLVFYRNLSRWNWLVIVGYMVHPTLMVFFAMEFLPYVARREALLARWDDLLIGALHYETVVIQGLFSLGLFLVFRDVASKINSGN